MHRNERKVPPNKWGFCNYWHSRVGLHVALIPYIKEIDVDIKTVLYRVLGAITAFIGQYRNKDHYKGQELVRQQLGAYLACRLPDDWALPEEVFMRHAMHPALVKYFEDYNINSADSQREEFAKALFNAASWSGEVRIALMSQELLSSIRGHVDSLPSELRVYYSCARKVDSFASPDGQRQLAFFGKPVPKVDTDELLNWERFEVLPNAKEYRQEALMVLEQFNNRMSVFMVKKQDVFTRPRNPRTPSITHWWNGHTP